MPTTKYVVFYLPDPSKMAEAGALFADHIQHSQTFHAAGKMLSFGPFADLIGQGSMGIFPSKELAEEFVAGDPFVKGEIVAKHEIREWTDTAG